MFKGPPGGAETLWCANHCPEETKGCPHSEGTGGLRLKQRAGSEPSGMSTCITYSSLPLPSREKEELVLSGSIEMESSKSMAAWETEQDRTLLLETLNFSST